MAAQEPLLASSPSRPESSSSKIFWNSIALIVIYYLIKEDPVCDQPLVLWMKFFSAVLAFDALKEVLKHCEGTELLTRFMHGINGCVSWSVGVGTLACI